METANKTSSTKGQLAADFQLFFTNVSDYQQSRGELQKLFSAVRDGDLEGFPIETNSLRISGMSKIPYGKNKNRASSNPYTALSLFKLLLKYKICNEKNHHYNQPIESFHLIGHTFRFRLQENKLSSVKTQAVPLECTHQELSFEW